MPLTAARYVSNKRRFGLPREPGLPEKALHDGNIMRHSEGWAVMNRRRVRRLNDSAVS